MGNKYLQENVKAKKTLKTIGIICLTIGIILIISGVSSAISTFNSFPNGGGPGFMFLIFFGFVLTGIGGSCLRYAYMGKVARYTASEIAPVVKDTANYMLDGTKDEIADFIHTVSGKKEKGETFNCPYCGDENDFDAVYCDYCGKKLKATCSCGTENAAGSRFCKKCGKAL